MRVKTSDTIDKIVTSYFAAVATEPFDYKGKTYNPKMLQVSVGMFTKRMNCVEDCGGCCNKFTLDWLPSEQVPASADARICSRIVTINGKERRLFTDFQNDNEGHHCVNLGEKARCDVHGEHPFSCDFELLRFSHFKQPHRNNYLNHRPYGRAWNMKRQDGERGALCEWYDANSGPVSEEMVTWQRDTVRRLMRLREWCRHWEIPNCVGEIIMWVRTGPHKEPLVTGNEYVNVRMMLDGNTATDPAVECDGATLPAATGEGGSQGATTSTEPERGDGEGDDLPWK